MESEESRTVEPVKPQRVGGENSQLGEVERASDIPHPYQIDFKTTLVLPFRMGLDDGLYECKRGRDAFGVSLESVDTTIGSDGPLVPEQETPARRLEIHAMTGQVTGARGVDLPGAYLRYSRASVIFTLNPIGELTEAQLMDIATDRAFTYLNHFLDVYRVAARDAEAWPLTLREFYDNRANQGVTSEIHLMKGEERFSLSSHAYGKDGRGLRMGPWDRLDSKVQETVRARAKAGEFPTLTTLLFMNAEALAARGDYRLSVIDGNAAMDIMVENKAIEWLVARGRTREEAERIGEKGTTFGLMTEHIVANCPSIKDNPNNAFNVWNGSPMGKKLRNRVVHDGYVPTKEEASESLKLVKEMIATVFYLRPSRPDEE